MKAIVGGASLEGMTAAWWLSHAGWNVVIVEQSPRLNSKGYVIDFVRSRSDVLSRMGMVAGLEPMRCRIARIAWTGIEEMEVAELRYIRLEELFGKDPLIVSQGDIARALLDQLPSQIERRFGWSIAAVREETDSIVVEFADGSVECADVLIGADGPRSRVRDLVFGVQQRFYTYLGYWTAGFVVRDSSLARRLEPDLKLMTAPGRMVSLCPMPADRVAVSFAHETLGSVIELKNLFADFGGMIPHVLASAPPSAQMCREQVLQVNLPRWCTDRVALLGDACHAASAKVGQEVTLAIANAYVLAERLSQETNVASALRSYEAQLRPALDRKQAAGRRLKKWLVPSTDFQIGMRNAVVNIANLRGMGWFLRRLVSTRVGSALLER
jgi:2-polyprenyl-6-methoxyphenol hydroxylase-like FAD-dependent oxidoreductase